MTQQESLGRGGRHHVSLVLLLAAAACGRPESAKTLPVTLVPFDAIVAGAHAVPLESASASDPTALQTTALVTAGEVVVVDEGRATVEAFRRDDGRHTRTIAEPGDRPGDLRHPRAIAPLDSGSYVILDTKRGVLSFRDSAGALRGETPVPPGFYSAMVPLRDRQRVLLAGEVYRAPQGARGRDLHEIDYGGTLVSSYGEAYEAKSKWEGTFTALSAAQIGTTIVTAMLSSNRVRLLDRTTGRARTVHVANGWYVPLDFPSDKDLKRVANPQGVADRVTKWAHAHLLANGIFALTRGRFVVRYQTFDEQGQRIYNYVLADTTGETSAVTRATTARVVATSGDTLFWLAPGQAGRTDFGLGVASADVVAHAVGRADSMVLHLAASGQSR